MRGEDADITRFHRLPGALLWVCSNRERSVFPGIPTYFGGRHEKAPVGCPCSRLAAVLITAFFPYLQYHQLRFSPTRFVLLHLDC